MIDHLQSFICHLLRRVAIRQRACVAAHGVGQRLAEAVPGIREKHTRRYREQGLHVVTEHPPCGELDFPGREVTRAEFRELASAHRRERHHESDASRRFQIESDGAGEKQSREVVLRGKLAADVDVLARSEFFESLVQVVRHVAER